MKAVILLAGGKGIRFNLGYNKLLYEINNKKIYEYSLEAFKDYKIYFVDPKGTKYSDYELKVDGFKKLFYEHDKPKVFKYNDLRLTVDLILVNGDPTSIGKEYRSFWKSNTDFTWIN